MLEDRILEYLDAETEYFDNERIVKGWDDLILFLGVDKYKYRFKRKTAFGNTSIDTPAIISDVAKKIVDQYLGYDIVLAIDELDASYARLTLDKQENDWSRIQGGPSDRGLYFVDFKLRVPKQ